MRIFKLLSLIWIAVAGFCTVQQAVAEERQAAVAGQSDTAAAETPKPDANGYYAGGPVYVSDRNKVWTRSGPSEGYRVNGARQIGEKMIFKRYSDNGKYAQLEADGETFWMPLDALQPESCGYSKEEELQQQIRDLQHRLDTYDSALAQKLRETEAERNALRTENGELKSAVSEKQSIIDGLDEQNRDYAERLQTRDLDMQMRWWAQGAIIALSGAIAGAIFIFIPRPSRKTRRERY